jgi:hypothetical protein
LRFFLQLSEYGDAKEKERLKLEKEAAAVAEKALAGDKAGGGEKQDTPPGGKPAEGGKGAAADKSDAKGMEESPEVKGEKVEDE